MTAVIDLEKNAVKVVAEYSDADIGNFQWVNENRLVFDLRDRTEASGDVELGPGLYAVNRDGSNLIQLADRTGYRRAPQPWNTFLLDQRGGQDSDWIYVRRPLYDNTGEYYGTRLRRINTVTGNAEIASEPDVEVSDFILDFKGEPRLAILYAEIKNTIYYRDPATDKWREVASYIAYGGAKDKIKPLGFGPNGTLFVVANAGANIATLRTFDLTDNKVSKDPPVPI